MSEAPDTSAPVETAGSLLRQARQAKGLHIAALAAAIKVVPRKLELLEANQFDQLPDATFTRALAQTVCRTLKIDPAPILRLLPPPSGMQRLEQVSGGLNTPFRERPGRLVPQDWSHVTTPALWVALLLLVGAGALYVLPAGWLPAVGASKSSPILPASAPPVALAAAASGPSPQGEAASDAEALGVGPGAASDSSVAGAASPASAPDTSIVVEPEALAAANSPGVLQLHASAESWVEVTDAGGQSLITRVLQPGETVGLDGTLPLKVIVGNAAGTQIVFRGQPLELGTHTRDNVARIELK
jgi:cytoskeleton protein RodZ